MLDNKIIKKIKQRSRGSFKNWEKLSRVCVKLNDDNVLPTTTTLLPLPVSKNNIIKEATPVVFDDVVIDTQSSLYNNTDNEEMINGIEILQENVTTNRNVERDDDNNNNNTIDHVVLPYETNDQDDDADRDDDDIIEDRKDDTQRYLETIIRENRNNNTESLNLYSLLKDQSSINKPTCTFIRVLQKIIYEIFLENYIEKSMDKFKQLENQDDNIEQQLSRKLDYKIFETYMTEILNDLDTLLLLNTSGFESEV